jgi:hypothetical protein
MKITALRDPRISIKLLAISRRFSCEKTHYKQEPSDEFWRKMHVVRSITSCGESYFVRLQVTVMFITYDEKPKVCIEFPGLR